MTATPTTNQPALTVRPPHLAAAETLVDHLVTLPPELARNRYRHAGQFESLPDQVVWGSPGAAETFYVLSQCASFLTRVFEHTYGPGTPYGWATSQFFRDHVYDWGPKSSGSPNSKQYRSAFARGIPHFRPVTAVRDLLPGDLVSIDRNQPGAVYSGHIVMIRRLRGLLTHAADQHFGQPVTPHVFEILDCNSRPHGDPVNFPHLFDAYPDTRALGGTQAGGVGYGHMVIYEDRGSGRLAGYRRSVDTDEAFTATERPIAAARIWP